MIAGNRALGQPLLSDSGGEHLPGESSCPDPTADRADKTRNSGITSTADALHLLSPTADKIIGDDSQLSQARWPAAPPADRAARGVRVRRIFWWRRRAENSEQRARRMAARRWGLGVAVLLGAFHLSCPFSIGVVQGSSMLPTYQPGQLFLLDRTYYRDHPIRRGDVVVVRCDDHTIIKRVFAVAGDSFWLLIQRDADMIDRYIVDPGMVERLRRAVQHWDLGRLTRLTVPRGSVYLLGDCSEYSIDSRAFGAVPTTAIVGRATPLRPGAGRVAVQHPERPWTHSVPASPLPLPAP
jgi:signal peptidase I